MTVLTVLSFLIVTAILNVSNTYNINNLVYICRYFLFQHERFLSVDFAAGRPD